MGAAEDFFQATQAAWQQAAAEDAPSVHCYCMAGRPVHLHIIGKTLAERLTPALAHLAVSASTLPDAEPASLTVLLWDRSVTSVPLPPSPWQEEDFRERSEVRGYQTGRFLAAYEIESSTLSLFDSQKRMAIYAVQNARQLPYYEEGMPLRTILHWGLRQQGRQLVHAAAVGNEQGGVLLVGKSGSGKSTTALASLLAGMRYVSDDYCAVAMEPEPRVYSLYSSGKVAADHLRHFPALQTLINNPKGLAQGEKALLLLHQYFSNQIFAHLPMRAILLPTITNRPETSIVEISKSETLRALAPSTIFQLANGGEQDFRFLTQLVRQVPAYRLNLGSELAQIPKVIRGFL